MKDVSDKSTKKELWEAYQELLLAAASQNGAVRADDARTFENRQAAAADAGARTNGAKTLPPKEASTPPQSAAATISASPVIQTLDRLRASVAETLESFGTHAEAFKKRAAEEEERLAAETARKRELSKREQEEYEYETKMKRRREEDEYALKVAERERTQSEKTAVKERDLKDREAVLATAEEELEDLRARV